ncbi:hypothetical protein BV25DRAFT_1970691 [Artomyces pyxidatus]|uniref:Uncharacterized protein n=1 Tax=Artomyces pyxidatus TaxID=48021 RepID=A0ACB8SMM9_9AGAM|nr:hypothetical protein BV25DRAFT_1970691 [Artomyces pyxidatus]
MDVDTGALLSSALQIREAIECASEFKAIGHCATKIRVGRKERYDLHGINIKDMPPTENETLVEELGQLYRNAPVHATGKFAEPFRLTITRRGCEHDDNIQPSRGKTSGEKDTQKIGASGSGASADEFFSKDSNEERRLKRLFENVSVSGYGDVRTQETKINLSVRNAREIPASEFTVAPALLDTIRTTWAAHFWPAAVRVVPYKIHLYGPGGGFKAHRDTPEAGLVGTFLVGLGDSTQAQNLEVAVQGKRDNAAFSACVGRWVAFYPDVPHRVVELEKGYRAVLAFKMFRADDDVDTAACDAGALQRVRAVTDRLSAPVGLFLEHKYCMGTQKLSGFDAVVYEALARRPGVAVHLLPVVTKWHAVIKTDDDVEMGYYGSDCDEDEIPEGSFEAPVYPLTAAHVQAVATGNMEEIFEYTDMADPVACEEGLAWLKSLTSDVQFLATDLESTTVTWSSDQEDLDYTGNESRPYSEDSVYLSYALVIVEKA